MLLLGTARRNIIITAFIIALATALRLLSDRSEVINAYPVLFYGLKLIVIIMCLGCIAIALKDMWLEYLKYVVYLVSAFFVITGELFAPGYNIEYSQLVIFVPLLLNIPPRTQYYYYIFALSGFFVALYFGQSREVVINGDERYFYNVVLSAITSTSISALFSLYVRKKDTQLESMKSKYTGLGIHTSMIIHDIKNSLMVPYRHFSEHRGDPEAERSLKIMGELIDKLRDVLQFQYEDQKCDPMKVIHEVAEELDIETRGVSVALNGDVRSLPISSNSLKSVVTNVFNNTIAVAERISMPVTLTVKCRYWGIEFRDNGLGFPPEAISNFNKYKPFTDRSLGSGLGLINSRVILDIAGGDMRIYNAPEGGAVVRIQFPIKIRG